MPIGPKLLLELVKKKKLVEDLSERELTNPEGAGFDLRLGAIHEIHGEGYLGITDRKTPNIKTLLEYRDGELQRYVFKPGSQCLVTTLESVNLPDDITANMSLRSTLYRSGMIFSGGNVAPGYSGQLSFTFFNSGRSPITIEMGARIVHILFSRVEGRGSFYRGQWRGGRVVVVKKEKQV